MRLMRSMPIAALALWLTLPAAAAAQEAAPAEDTAGSLFAPGWNEVEFGGRWTSTSGDAARFQRYQDLRSGVLVDGMRVSRETDVWSLQFGADNIGYRDQRYAVAYERTGLFSVTGLWDQIPQFYSIDTRTPYTPIGGTPIGLDDATQRAIQLGQTNSRAYIPQAQLFEMRERRDTGLVSATVTPARAIDITGTFATSRHSGELPWGASFGFSNDVEVALPYDSRTNDLSLGAEWAGSRGLVRVAYDGSWYDNLEDTLVWDSPLRLDPIVGGPAQGRMALWPSNTAHTVSAAGNLRLARRTQATAFVSFGSRSNDQPLLPFTINPALSVPALPRATTEGEAQIFAANLSLVSRPIADWRFSARLRRYDFNNETPHAAIPQFVSYDASLRASPTGGPELFAHDRTTVELDGTWSGLGPVALSAGYMLNAHGWEHRIFESSNEHVLSLKADAVGTNWVSFRAHYDHAERTGDGLDEASLIHIGEQPRLRHFDVANRTRDKFVGQVDFTPTDAIGLSVNAGFGADDYPDSYFGLQESTFRVVGAAVDATSPQGLGVGGSYNVERYTGLQRSRSATPGAQAADPARDWTADTSERVHYFSVYATPPRFGRTEARLSYDYAKSRGRYLYGLAAGSPLPAPAQLPEVFNELQQLRVDVRYRLSAKLRASIAYLYEPFEVFDFAFDPSVIDSIIQPSSLVLGYVARPYTAHSAVASLIYAW
jgi:MtrB/PioB family decaheme-associated outer membrane protein